MNRFLIILALTAGIVGSASANLLVNGDFALSVPSNGTGNGWTSLHVDGAGGWESVNGNPGGNFILNDSGGGTNPSIWQDVTLTVGQSYAVSGDYAYAHAGGNGNRDFGVEIDGNLWEYEVPVSTAGWLHFNEVFVATNANLTLLLTGERHGDYDPRIDNISLDVVPEPASMTFLGIGLLAILRKRR